MVSIDFEIMPDDGDRMENLLLVVMRRCKEEKSGCDSLKRESR